MRGRLCMVFVSVSPWEERLVGKEKDSTHDPVKISPLLDINATVDFDALDQMANNLHLELIGETEESRRGPGCERSQHRRIWLG